jgi:hypothetical protein
VWLRCSCVGRCSDASAASCAVRLTVTGWLSKALSPSSLA